MYQKSDYCAVRQSNDNWPIHLLASTLLFQSFRIMVVSLLLYVFDLYHIAVFKKLRKSGTIFLSGKGAYQG